VSSTSQHSQSIWLSNMSAKISNELKYALRTLWGSQHGLPKVSFQCWSYAALILSRVEGVIKTLTYFLRNNVIASILQLVVEWSRCLHASQTILGSHARQIGLAVRTVHERIFGHLLHPSNPDAQKNCCRAALLHPSGNWECCNHLLDGQESKSPAEASPVRNQFITPGGDDNIEYTVSWPGGHWDAIPHAARVARCP
jgi:hypothetical protein